MGSMDHGRLYRRQFRGSGSGCLPSYDIGQPLTFKGIAEGIENSNFYLQTDRGAFILTLYEKRVHADDLPFFLGLMEHLAARGIACPLPVRRKDGTQWTTLNGRQRRIVTFLTGIVRCAGPTRPIAPRPAPPWPRCTRRATTSRSAAPMRWALPAGALVDKTASGADGIEDGLRELIASADREADAALATGPAGRRDPCRFLSRQCPVHRTRSVGADRFLFRLQ